MSDTSDTQRAIKEILGIREGRVRANRSEALDLSPLKHRQRERQLASVRANWPVYAHNLQPAALDPGDVQMPPPPQPVPLDALRRRAESPSEPEALDVIEREELAKNRRAAHEADRQHAGRFYGPWSPEIVDEWLVEMNAVLIRLPVETRPRGIAAARIPVISEFQDVVAREENRSQRHLRNSVSHRWGPVSIEEMRRSDLSMMWCGQYLRHDPALARCVGLGARWKALGAPLKRRCREVLKMWPSQFFKWRGIGLTIIAESLTRDAVRQ